MVAADLKTASYLSIITQHASSNFSEQSLDFAAYLFFITLFPRTLIPASLLGLSMTLGSCFLSTRIGKMVDRWPRLSFARRAVFVQKIAQIAVHLGFLALFSIDREGATWPQKRAHLQHFTPRHVDMTPPDTSAEIAGLGAFIIISWIVLCATIGRLATTGITLAVDRDWIVVIAGDRPATLTKLNTSLRRTFLLTKLVSPFLVSLVTTFLSYRICTLILMGVSVASLGGEQWMIGVVWRGSEALSRSEAGRRGRRDAPLVADAEQELDQPRQTGYALLPVDHDQFEDEEIVQERPAMMLWISAAQETVEDFAEFTRLPVFLSSLSIALLYLTTLSFDGILLSWLKSSQGCSDAFIASMRGICILTGLAGTFVMPLGEKYLGLVRTGAWSIWSEAACLCAVLLALCSTFTSTGRLAPLSAALFFTSVALSRVGLYAFDLVQVQEIQLALKDHPKSGSFQGAQMGMQSGMEVLKYGIVLILHKPEQFPWTALISTVAVIIGGLLYTRYVYQVRGHLLHWRKLWGDARHA